MTLGRGRSTKRNNPQGKPGAFLHFLAISLAVTALEALSMGSHDGQPDSKES